MAKRYHLAVFGASLGATILAILAIAVNEAWIGASVVGNFTAAELGVFAGLLAAVAVALYLVE